MDEKSTLEAAGPKGDKEASLIQATAYRRIIRKMLFIGSLSAPLILLHASLVATKIAGLHTLHLDTVEAAVKRLKLLSSELHFTSPSESHCGPLLLNVILDVAMAASGGIKGRGDHIVFRRLGNLVYRIHWSSRQLRRVS